MKLFVSENIEKCLHIFCFIHCRTRRWSTVVIILILLLYSTQKIIAQNEKTYPTYINSMYTSGHIRQHSLDVSHTIRGFTHGFDLFATNLIPIKTKMDDRQKLVYLDVGVHYINYPMDFLGESFALTFGRSGEIWHHNKFQLRGQFMYGIGFCTNPFTLNNNRNNAISTHIGFHLHANLTGTYPIYNNWYALFALGYSHLSNAAIQKPNQGYNVLSTNLGVAYHIKDKTINETFDYYKHSRKYYYHIIGTYFPTASRSYSGEKFTSFSFHTQIERNLSLQHSLLLSLDYFNNKEERYPPLEKPKNAGNNENNYVGISIGGNWKYSIVDFNLTTGYYLIYPWDVGRKHYSLVHFKVYVLKNKYLLVGLRSHGFSAVNFEVGIGFKI